MYLSCDTKKFHDNESTHILHNFWTSTDRGEASRPSPLAAPLRRAVKSCRVRVQKHPLVHDNEQCKPIVIETIKFLYDLDMEDGKDVDLTNPIARPRVPHEIMFVIGGWSGGSPTNVIETYDTRADRWITVE